MPFTHILDLKLYLRIVICVKFLFFNFKLERDMNNLKIGDIVYVASLATEYSSFYPEIIPRNLKTDSLVGGALSIRRFIQTEILPEDKKLYRAEIEEIEITDQEEKGRIIINIFLKNLENVISVSRRNFSIANLRGNRFNSDYSNRERKFRQTGLEEAPKNIDGVNNYFCARIFAP